MEKSQFNRPDSEGQHSLPIAAPTCVSLPHVQNTSSSEPGNRNKRKNLFTQCTPCNCEMVGQPSQPIVVSNTHIRSELQGDLCS